MPLVEAAIGAAAFVLASWVWIQLVLRALELSPPAPHWRIVAAALTNLLAVADEDCSGTPSSRANSDPPLSCTFEAAQWEPDDEPRPAASMHRRYATLERAFEAIGVVRTFLKPVLPTKARWADVSVAPLLPEASLQAQVKPKSRTAPDVIVKERNDGNVAVDEEIICCEKGNDLKDNMACTGNNEELGQEAEACEDDSADLVRRDGPSECEREQAAVQQDAPTGTACDGDSLQEAAKENDNAADTLKENEQGPTLNPDPEELIEMAVNSNALSDDAESQAALPAQLLECQLRQAGQSSLDTSLEVDKTLNLEKESDPPDEKEADPPDVESTQANMASCITPKSVSVESDDNLACGKWHRRGRAPDGLEDVEAPSPTLLKFPTDAVREPDGTEDVKVPPPTVEKAQDPSVTVETQVAGSQSASHSSAPSLQPALAAGRKPVVILRRGDRSDTRSSKVDIGSEAPKAGTADKRRPDTLSELQRIKTPQDLGRGQLPKDPARARQEAPAAWKPTLRPPPGNAAATMEISSPPSSSSSSKAAACGTISGARVATTRRSFYNVKETSGSLVKQELNSSAM